MKRHVFAAALGFLLVIVPVRDTLRADAILYTVEDLGTIDNLVPVVTGMNASGQISGYVSGTSTTVAVWYDGAAWHYVQGASPTYSIAMAINDSGQIAGYEVTPDGYRAFRSAAAGTAATTIDPLPGGSFAVAFGINGAGEVVGYGDSSSGTRGWRAAGTTPAMLPTLGGAFGIACGINDLGQIAGSAATADDYQHAYRIEADNTTVLDLGTFDGPTGTSVACAIDEHGHIGGRSSDAGVFRAFRSGDTTPLLNLDAFGSTFSNVEAVSDGTSVGWFSSPADGSLRAFVHTPAEGSSDLNSRIAPDSGWILAQAFAANPSGQIAGVGTLNGVPRAFRLTKSGDTDTAAPVISQVSATPSIIWPPNGSLVAVTVQVVATDDIDDAPVCALTSIAASSTTADDFSITGPLSARLRAIGGRTYTLNVTCSDTAGNHAAGSTTVVVPPDTTAPSISGILAMPGTVWPPNGKMVPVTVTISATDDVDAVPQCSLTSVTTNDAATGDAALTGPFAAVVRATRNADGSTRIYTLHATCADAAGNRASAEARVLVAREPNSSPQNKQD